MNKFNLPWLPILFALVSIISILVGMRLQDALVLDQYINNQPKEEEEAIFQATQHIVSKYYGELDKQKFTDEVLSAMIAELDPYSHYFHQDNNETYNRFINGVYEGVGIKFKNASDTTYISLVIPNSPAEEAGLARGDFIRSMEGINVVGLTLDSILNISRKKIGETLSMDILKHPGKELTTVDLIVADVELPMILDYRIKTDIEGHEISYVKIRRFDNDIFKTFMETIERHHKGTNKIEKLIVDLRDNPGGLVEESVKILNQMFEDKEQILLSTRNSNNKNKTYKSNGRNFIQFDRVVVLCNENTASASEIVAGVLQDYDKAILLGTNTFGKGLIQQNYDLANNGSISLSIGEYILPSGRSIYLSSDDTLTQFTSLRSNRPLNNIKGVEVDVEINSCPISDVQRIHLDELVLKNGLWEVLPSEDMLSSFTDLSDLSASPADNCATNSLTALRWELCQEIIEAGSQIDIDDVDGLMLKAIELLNSDAYSEILGL